MSRLALPVAFLLLAVACSRPAQPILPQQVSAWAKQGETRTYTADNLYEYIDGDAEKYIQAGLKVTLTADYRYQGKFDAVADVFVMKDPDGARKVFESQPAVGARALELGDAARLYSGSVTFRQGAYFVRLVAYDSRAGDALADLGRAIETKLK